MFAELIKIFVLLLALSTSLSAKEFKVAIPNAIKNIDPLTAKTAQENFMIPLVYETLFFRDLRGDLLPLLAMKFEVDDKNLIIHLNRAIFSDGKELVAEDVIDSLKTYCKLERLSVRLSSLDGCSPNRKLKYEILSKNSIKLATLTHPKYAVEQLATTSVPIIKRSGSKLLGTGTFKVEKVDGDVLRLSPNEKNLYWKGKKTLFDTFVFEHVPEKVIKTKLELEGFHLASMYLTPTVMPLDGKGYDVVTHTDSVVSSIVLNRENEVFKDKKLRLSLQKTLGELKFDQCEFGKNKLLGLIPEGVGGYIEDDVLREQVSKRTLYRLKEAKKVSLYRHEGRRSDCEERLIKEAFSQHNVQLEILYEDDYDVLYPRYLDPNTAGYIELFVYNSMDASSLLKRFTPSKDLSIFFYRSKSIQGYLSKAMKEPLASGRFDYYRKINREVFDEAIFLPMYSVAHSNVLKKCLNAKKEFSTFYNPNTFLFILDVVSSKSLKVCK